MKYILRNRNFYYMFCMDAALVAASYLLAYYLRFDAQVDPDQWVNLQKTIAWVIPVKMSAFFLFGLYRGMWRYTGLVDLKNILVAVVVSSLLVVLIISMQYRFYGFSRSVYLIDSLLTLLFVGGIRVFVRIWMNRGFGYGTVFNHHNPHMKRLLIIGAGAAGEKVIREIAGNSSLRLIPIGFLDDDRTKRGMSIHGVQVLGRVKDIEELDANYDEILISIPSATTEEMRVIVSCCEATGKPFRTIPALGELIDGKISMQTVREVRLEDLMNREEVRLEKELLQKSYRGKRVIVTGAGGSIGSELVRQICRYEPSEISLVDFSEFNLFQVEMMCRKDFPNVPICAHMTDVRDRRAVDHLFRKFRPEIVFHAAAYKHVPLQEMQPRETVFNNVLGTKNLVDAALGNNVERFVLVSTDKAVRPTNVMGAAKRVAEMYLQGINGSSRTRFMAVRFGNVLGSSGSVIPIFNEQIAQRRPVTVTHPEVTRYFMSIPEAAQLILQAGAMGEGGEIFILDMGKPVRIVDMAKELIRLHGFEPGKDIPIEFVGLRPGEKLFEELITTGEGIAETLHQKIKVIRNEKTDFSKMGAEIDQLLSVADSYDAKAIKQKLQDIVPEYLPQ